MFGLASLLKEELIGLGISNRVTWDEAAVVRRDTHPSADEVKTDHEEDRIRKELGERTNIVA